jgi:DNA-3-methyladenine glycosylase II
VHNRSKLYAEATLFLRNLDEDWAQAVDAIGPCTHEPKAAREPYEALIRAVAYQQLTAKAGDATIARLCALCGGMFPDPAVLLSLNIESLRACGFSRTKSMTVQDIARGVQSGSVPSGRQAKRIKDEKLIECLTSIKGVGRWTVEMLLMYSLERTDILPADDFGVRDGYRRLKRLHDKPTARDLRVLSAAWSPYRTIASWYLWRVR